MEKERRKLRFELLIERYFTNFHRIILSSLIFAVPSAALFAAFYFLTTAIFSGAIYIPFILLVIIPLFPFYTGVVAVCRNISRGDSKVPVFHTFITAFRLNFPVSLLNGLLVYIASTLSFISISLYISKLSEGWFFYGLLFFSILIALFLLYMTFYIPLLTITYDLPLKYIYKNAFLMAFGEIKNNFFATLGIIISGGIFFTAIAVCGSAAALIIVISSLWALLIPSTFTYMYAFFAYDGMSSIMSSKEERSKELDAKIDERTKKKPQVPVAQEEDFSDIDVNSLKDTDDYIFHNGKMVKQSTLLRMIREREQGDKNE